MPADTVETMLARVDERTHRMDERDGRIEKKLDAHCNQLGDHEKRIGCLEGFKMSVYIASVVVVTLVGLAVAAFGLF
jgi:hypothetical protein